MYYGVNELLHEEDVAVLTEEAFRAPARRARPWRRAGSLAACALLAVGLVNAGALAAGAQRVWSYITGVGAVEAGSRILVQGAPLVWEMDGLTYTLRGAYEKDGVVSLSVLLCAEKETTGDAWFDIALLEDGEPCSTVWGDYDAERSITPFLSQAQWDAEATGWGYLMPQRYKGGGSFAGTSPSFHTAGSGSYTVELWTSRDGRRGEPLTAQLDLVTPESQSFLTYSRPQDGGLLTALVSADGRRVSFSLDDADGGLSLRCPYGLWFIDEAGDRFQGALVSGPANLPTQSVEVCLEAATERPIVAIEVGALLLYKTDGSGTFLGYEDRPALNWTIALQ